MMLNKLPLYTLGVAEDTKEALSLYKQGGPISFLQEKVFGNPEAKKEFENKVEWERTKPLLAVAALGLSSPFFVRALRSRFNEKKRKKRLDMFDRVSAKSQPMIELDSDSLDNVVYRKMQENKKSKESRDKGRLLQQPIVKTGNIEWDMLAAPWKTLHSVLGVGDTKKEWTYPAWALAALAVGSSIGWKYSDKINDKKYNAELKDKIKSEKKKLDDIQFRALAQQRGITYPEKEEEEEEGEEENKEAITKKAFLGNLDNVGAGLLQLIPLYALALGYGGYKAGEHIAKETSPKNEAYKAMKLQIENQIKTPNKPAELRLSPGGRMRTVFGPTTEKERKKREEEIAASGAAIG